MNIYREGFEKKKDDLVNLINRTIEYYEKYKMEGEIEDFKVILDNVKNNEFSIVLVGEFSAGKSTFLNALMGEKILPTFTNETTSTINFLRHKEKALNEECGRVYFKDGSIEILHDINNEILKRYVSTEGEVEIRAKVSYVDLYLNSKYLEGNLTLIDSPGLNGIEEGLKEITQNQIKKANASIFMFKSNQPGSETDFKFLKEVKSKINTVIFLLNKIDDIKSSEGENLESVISELKEGYKLKFPDEKTIPEIWGISAYQALVARSKERLDYRDRDDFREEEKKELLKNSKIEEFEERLWRFLTKGEKGIAMLLSPNSKITCSLRENRRKLQEEIDLLSGKIDIGVLQENINKVRNQIEEITLNLTNASNKITSSLEVIIYEVEDEVEIILDKIKESNVNRITTWNDIEELLEYEATIISRAEGDYKKGIERGEKAFIRKLKDLISQNYVEIAEEINNNLSEDSINTTISTKYSPSEYEMNLNIEEYENKLKELNEELKEKEESILAQEQNILKLRREKRERELITDNILNVEAQLEACLNLSPPPKEYVDEKYTKLYKNAGVFGNINSFFKGPKRIEFSERKLLNEDEIKAFKEDKERRIREFNSKINKLEDKYRILKGEGVAEEEIEVEKIRLLEEESKIKERIFEEQQYFKENYIKKNKGALRNRKYELESYFDELNSECMFKIREELNNKKRVYEDLIKWVIQNNLNRKLIIKNKELMLLEEKFKSSKEEKFERIKLLKKMEEECEEILSFGISLQKSIEEEEIDEIKQVSL